MAVVVLQPILLLSLELSRNMGVVAVVALTITPTTSSLVQADLADVQLQALEVVGEHSLRRRQTPCQLTPEHVLHLLQMVQLLCSVAQAVE
jgi:hypothetical protein